PGSRAPAWHSSAQVVVRAARPARAVVEAAERGVAVARLEAEALPLAAASAAVNAGPPPLVLARLREQAAAAHPRPVPIPARIRAPDVALPEATPAADHSTTACGNRPSVPPARPATL